MGRQPPYNLSMPLMLALFGLDPQNLINKFGLIGLFIIVFAESGLLIGFFLPGDSLLFTAGLLIATNKFDPLGESTSNVTQLIVTMLVIFAAAVLGDQVGYQFGKRVGPSLFNRPKSRLFDPKNAKRAQDFFERYGVKTIVMARFVPIVRTFAPVVAGIGSMSLKTFTTFNVIGGALWGIGVPFLGFVLGERFPILEKRIDLVAAVIIVVSVAPMIFEIWREKKRHAAASGSTTP